MLEFYTYSKTNGKIGNSGYFSPGFSPVLRENQKIILGKRASPEQYHDLDTDKLIPRPTLNIDDITLIVDQEYNPPNIPSGTIVNVDDEDVGIVDNTGLILVFPVAKTYKLQLKPPFPYFEKTITIEVITE